MDLPDFALHLYENFVATSIDYFLIASLSFLIFYVLLKRIMRHRKIQTEPPKFRDYRRDILFSILSMGIFSVMSYVTIVVLDPYNNLYWRMSAHSTPYFLFTFVWMFFLHDTYFYWMHRLMHHPKIYKYVHLVHHRATNPTPWSAYAFHPIEAVVETSFFTVVAFLIPVHVAALGSYSLFQISYNVYAHLGYEILPAKINRHWLGKYMSTSVSHNQHHQYFKHNFGLWTTIWDRLMGTLSQRYDETFDRVTRKNKQQAASDLEM